MSLPYPFAQTNVASHGLAAFARHEAGAWDDAEGRGAQVGVRGALPPSRLRLEIRAGGPARQAGGRGDQDRRAPGLSVPVWEGGTPGL